MGSQSETVPVRTQVQDYTSYLEGCTKGGVIAMSLVLAVPSMLFSGHPDLTPGAGVWLVRDFGPEDTAELHNRTGQSIYGYIWIYIWIFLYSIY